MIIKHKYKAWIFGRSSQENKSKEKVLLNTLLLSSSSSSRHSLSLSNLYLFDLFEGFINHINSINLSCICMKVRNCVIRVAASICTQISLKVCSVIFIKEHISIST